MGGDVEHYCGDLQSGPSQHTLRSVRKPGHCWQDNELYDAFQPIIGPMPTLVYAQMTRLCVDVDEAITFSLRELASAVGASKDTVQRSLAILQLVGMVQIESQGPKRHATYRLVDLKDLVMDLGGAWCRKRRSYVLPELVTARLKASVKAAVRDLQRKPAAKEARLKPEMAGRGENPNLSLRATDLAAQKPVENPFLPPAESDSCVAQSDRSVAPERQVSSYRKNNRLKTNHPLPPPCQEGARNEAAKPNQNAAARTQRQAMPSGLMAVLSPQQGVEAKWVRLSNELDKHLLALRPPKPHLADGLDDWRRYRLGELAVVDARMVGQQRVLVLSSPDPEATREGLRKYHATLERLARKWFDGGVRFEVVVAAADPARLVASLVRDRTKK